MTSREERAALYQDLAGVAEVAQALNVPASRVKRWIELRETTHCPQPVRPLRAGNVYSLADWRAWYALWKVTRESQPSDR